MSLSHIFGPASARRARGLTALAFMVFSLLLAVPAQAGQAEINLLAAYIGNWKGSGEVTGGEEPQDFTCRMSVTQGPDSKIYYSGRCTLVGMNLAVRGAIAYNDSARRYEAAMSSNTRFAGTVFGTRSGDRITFDFRQRQITDENDNEISVGSQIILEGDTISVNFEVNFGDSDATMKTSVPFTRS